MIAFFEIPTNDFDKSVAFYQALFGEKLEVSQFGDEKMACLMKDGKSVCSISSAPSFPRFRTVLTEACWCISRQRFGCQRENCVG